MAATSCSNVEVDEVEGYEYLKQNLDQIQGLLSFHQERLTHVEDDIQKLERFVSDYEILRARLVTLPDKPRYEAIVPIGPVAYMKGCIVRTNEIHALLGDNWFAEVSAKQAVAIVSRRIQVCQDKLKSLRSAQQIHKGWVDESQKIIHRDRQDVDITEEISEEQYHKLSRKTSSRVPISASVPSDEELFKRLEQLEMQEDQNRELDISSSSGSESDESMEEDDESQDLSMQTDQENILSFRREKLQRRVSWADQRPGDDADEKYKVLPEADPVPEDPENQASATPSDLYKMYRSNSLSKGSQSKSILKKTLSNPTVQEAGNEDFETWFQGLSSSDDKDVPMPKVPLSESAKERKTSKVAFEDEAVSMDDSSPVSEDPPTKERKPSRFKMSRLKN